MQKGADTMAKESLAQVQDLDYFRSEDLRILAEKVIEEKNMKHLNGCVIEYLFSTKAKKSNKRIVHADCYKVPDKTKAICHTDFIITFYMPNIDEMTNEQLEILMYHELKHIGYDDGVCSLLPHDIEDFEEILIEYGMHWSEV